MKKIRFSLLINLLAGAMVLVGLTIVVLSLHVRATNAEILAQPPTLSQQAAPYREPTHETALSGRPTELTIPSLGLKSQIIEGAYNSKSGEWTLTTNKVQFASMTREPNDKAGLTFMYGHNRKEVFSKLLDIEIGSTATLRTENYLFFSYKLKDRKSTTPEDASIFNYDGPPVLVLQTCTGLFFQNRELFIFEYTGVTGND